MNFPEIMARLAAELALFAGIGFLIVALAGQRSAPATLANGGTLGASQAGARLTYNFTRQLAASLRTTSVVGKRGGERGSSQCAGSRCGRPPNAASRSANMAAGATPSPCSSKAGCGTSRCR